MLTIFLKPFWYFNPFPILPIVYGEKYDNLKAEKKKKPSGFLGLFSKCLSP